MRRLVGRVGRWRDELAARVESAGAGTTPSAGRASAVVAARSGELGASAPQVRCRCLRSGAISAWRPSHGAGDIDELKCSYQYAASRTCRADAKYTAFALR